MAFSQFVKKTFTTTQDTEDAEISDVKKFLANSNEMQQIRKIYLTNPDDDLKSTIQELDGAATFSKILEITKRFDFNNTKDTSVKRLGRNGMNILFFVAGYVHNGANFAYYMLHLRENAIEVMSKMKLPELK